ncbi:MAG: alpha/beta hydrolase [Oscillospiraceae bacterium]
MLFKESGSKHSPTIILLHGGGLSDWSLTPIANRLSLKYHVITTIIDGHGEDSESTFVSIEKSALKIIDYINHHENGRVYAIAGLSIGAQLVCEVLSKEPAITEYAAIESALVYPIKGTTALTVPTYKLCYGFVKKRWFAKMQAKTLCVPDDLFEVYFQDSLKISKESLVNITLSNGNYTLKQSISDTQAKVLIILGEKEIGVMKKSANLLRTTLKNSNLFVAPKMKHGELSLIYHEKYVEQLELLFAK